MESYYLDAVTDGEPPGVWSGRLAERYGLTGQVIEEDLERLLSRFEAPDGTRLGSVPRNYRSVQERVDEYLDSHPDALPEQVAEVRSRAEDDVRSGRVAYDLTLSVPKSVSAAHVAVWRAELEADRSGDAGRAAEFRQIRTGIEDAIRTANSAALDHVQNVTYTRAGAHGRAGSNGRWVQGRDLAIASFLQHTSRSIDPQLHIHNVVFRNAQDAEGKVRAIDSLDLREERKAYSAVSERVLAEEMTRRGLSMSMRRDGKSREVEQVPDEVNALFSHRRQVIGKQLAVVKETAEERLGRSLTPLETSRLARKVTLFTRAAKSHDGESFQQMLDRWQQEIRDELGAGLVPLAEKLRQAYLDRHDLGPVDFSADAVVAQAIQACAEKSAAWGRAELLLELDRALPVLGLTPGDATELLGHLADRALTSEGVVQVAGIDRRPAPADLVGEGVVYTRPSSQRWAAPVTLQSEDLIRRAAIERGAHSLDRAAVGAWLDANYPTISPEQRVVVEGLAGSDARLAQIVAAAGTGKSFTSGALAGAWGDLSGGGRVQGLTVSEIAAQVLRGDGVEVSRNLAAWLAAQDRIAAGRALPADEALRVRATDILLVDEASMVATAQLDRVRALAEAAGARVVLAGDPQQLAAVEAGGALSLLDGRAETYTLSEVRRFAEPWEAAASLRLRDGDLSALDEYDRHGRIVDAATLDDAVAEAAKRTAADLVDGKDAIAVAGTNDLAARIASAVRDHLVAAGRVEADGVHLPMDGTTAAVGDRVMTRQIDRVVGVLNRERWTVADLLDDGGLRVVNTDGETRDLPPAYVAEHVQSGYAGTGYAVQGVTVDRAVNLQDGNGDLAGLYVPGTRGRERNTFVVALRPEPGADAAGPAHDQQFAPSGRAVLAGVLENQLDNLAARVQQEHDAAWNASMSTIAGKLDDVTHLATMDRLGRDLDQLAAESVLAEDDRARLCADQSLDHLARVVRAAEQSGTDSFEVLRDAIVDRELDTATSVAQVLATRIERAGAVHGMPSRTAPDRLPAHWQTHYDALQEAARERTRALGTETAQQPPAWATSVLGPVPDDAMARLEWEARAGAVAAYREVQGWDDENAAIGGPGKRTETEKRALYLEAWDALGRPDAGRDEAGMTDGQLRARVAAWEREQTWAPPHADPALRHAELEADAARADAVLARAAGDTEQADALAAEHERQATVARSMETVADARATWVQDTAWTRAVAEAAGEELTRRGLAPNAEPDRVDADEWLAAERAAREADDAHRTITETDLADEHHDQEVSQDVHEAAVDVDQAEDVPDPVDDVPDEDVVPPAEPGSGRAQRSVTVDPTDVELDASLQAADRAVDIAADRAAQEAAHQALTEYELTDHDATGWDAPADGDDCAAADLSAVAE